MTKPTSASEWLETDVPYPHRTLLELRLVAMLRDANAELEKAERIIERAHITVPHPLGWSAIEAKWKSGGYG